MYRTNDFEAMLKKGQKKEKLLLTMLNWIGVQSIQNNKKDVTDIDIELTNDNILIDVKYMNTPYYSSFRYTGIQPKDCLTVQKRHIETYNSKEKNTGKEVWIACFVEYDDFDVKELLFFKNTQLKKLIDKESTTYPKLHFKRSSGLTFQKFLNYIQIKREIRD